MADAGGNDKDNAVVGKKKRISNGLTACLSIIGATFTVAAFRWETTTVLGEAKGSDVLHSLNANESKPFEGSVNWIYIIDFDSDAFNADSGYTAGPGDFNGDPSNTVSSPAFVYRAAYETYWFWVTTLMLFVGSTCFQMKWATRKRATPVSDALEIFSPRTQRACGKHVARVITPAYFALILAHRFHR
jgi:hypothetical protein